MAAIAGIDVPVHGLLSAIDGSWIYFIKRFDRVGRKGRVHVEDFSQLMGSSRETKYESSLEQVTQLVDKFRTFPGVEKPRLAKRLLFCFLTGNEDMHLKNFSIWHRETEDYVIATNTEGNVGVTWSRSEDLPQGFPSSYKNQQWFMLPPPLARMVLSAAELFESNLEIES